MFSPPSYVPLTEFLRKWDSERYEAHLNIAADVWTRDAVGGFLSEEEAFEAFGPSDTLEDELFAVLDGYLTVSSPRGELMRLDNKVFTSCADWRLTSEKFKSAAMRQPGVSGLPWSFSLSYRLIYSWSSDVAFSLKAAQEKDPDVSPWHLLGRTNSDRSHRSVPPFHERIGYIVSLRAFDYAKSLELPIPRLVEETAAFVRPFEGWALCAPRELLESKAWHRLIKQADAVPLEQRRVGRPSEVFVAYLRACQRLFPNGRSSQMTLGEVWTKLIAETDLEGSESTVKRVVREVKHGLSQSRSKGL